ncbi:MAG: ABC transporter permease [Oscillospiraceae bacterium]|nr:ABC transporter permease [Oscillospiraceae bacterium]
MKSYLSLVLLSARVHKRQSRMTVICIVLAVFLVTAIFSMADMELRAQKIHAIKEYGNWHIQLNNISDSDAALISERPDVEASSWYFVLNYRLRDDYYIGGKKTGICGIEEDFITKIFAEEAGLAEGDYPQGENQILLTLHSKTSLGIDIGGNVTIDTPYGPREFTVSGFGLDTVQNDKYDAIIAFMPIETYQQFHTSTIGQEDADKAYYVKFKTKANIKKAIADIKEQYGLSDKDVGQNTALLGIMGLSDNSYMMGLYFIALILFLLVLTAGVLMIAGSMNSSVARRTEFFGMLRCIGAGRKQIMRLVRLEALNYCKTAIPIGTIAGASVTWGLCAALRILSEGYFGDMPILGISAVGIVMGVLVGLMTVLLAARSPAKRASRVSPLAAVSGNAMAARVRRAANTRLVKIETALGISHGWQSKKNFFLMVGSFALSIVLFLSFYVLVDFMGYAIHSMMPYTPDLSILSHDNTCSVDRDLAPILGGMNGIKRVYGRSFYFDIPAELPGEADKVTLVSYEANQFNWADEKHWVPDKRGLEKVVKEDGYVLAVYSPANPLKVGDIVQTELGTVTVAGILEHFPFDALSGNINLVCSESTFKKLTGESDYTIIDIQLAANATEEDVSAIRAEAGSLMFSDQRLSNRNARGVYYAFALFVYGFLAIIVLIAVFNIMNSISMSVAARIKQYGAMRAIGIGLGQLKKMILAESLTYSVCGSIVGCLIGLPLHRLIYMSMITGHWGSEWGLPIMPLAVIVLLVIVVSALAVKPPMKQIRAMSIVETVSAQ